MEQFASSLICACRKAINIAVTCRTEPQLLGLLTQEKGTLERQGKVEYDFKTLADVLIQEAIRHDLGEQYPELSQHIFGEENNKFTNALGHTVVVEVKQTREETKKMLSEVLDGNEEVSEILSIEVHKKVEITEKERESISKIQQTDIDVSKLGIWIDPIDGTAHYIKGIEKSHEGMITSGLQVVTVLIGVFDMTNGEPLLGIVGRPFSTDRTIYFGGCLTGWRNIYPAPNEGRKSSADESKPIILIGSSETPEYVAKLGEKFEVVKSGGAGNKLLQVLEGRAQLYVNTSPTVYEWDTCGPHALILAAGGGICTFKDQDKELTYHAGDGEPSQFVHADGLVAFTDHKYLKMLQEIK